MACGKKAITYVARRKKELYKLRNGRKIVNGLNRKIAGEEKKLNGNEQITGNNTVKQM